MFYNLVHLRTQNQNSYLEFPKLVLYWCGIQHFTGRCILAAGPFEGVSWWKINDGRKGLRLVILELPSGFFFNI